MMPFFSIIIPLYNKEHLIETTIKSLLNQSFKNFEAIIVNDGCTDNSLKKTEALIDDRFKIITQKNHGASHARNTGIKQAMGDYIALLDADDFWYDNHLRELEKLIKTFPEAGLFCNNYEINYSGNFIKAAVLNFNYRDKPLIVKDYFKSSIINSVAWTSSVSFKKETFNKIGEFNLDLRTGQDIDLWIRFALHYSIAFNPKVTMTYNNFSYDNLSKKEYNDDRYHLISNYLIEEQKNTSLKLYLDINRYALALRCKMNNQLELYHKLIKEINYKNLNLKQKILLKLPVPLLKFLKWFQNKLINKKIYLTAYK